VEGKGGRKAKKRAGQHLRGGRTDKPSKVTTKSKTARGRQIQAGSTWGGGKNGRSISQRGYKKVEKRGGYVNRRIRTKGCTAKPKKKKDPIKGGRLEGGLTGKLLHSREERF